MSKATISHYPKDSAYRNAKLMPQIRAIKNNELPYIEFLKTIEGEGPRVGTLIILARLAGCPIGCNSCDTPYSFPTKNRKRMSVQNFITEVSKEAKDFKVREISITGGEPMMYPKQMEKVGRALQQKGFTVTMETSGLIIDSKVFAAFNHVFIDIKTPSSGVIVPQKTLDAALQAATLHAGVHFKAIVANKEDLQWIDMNLSLFFSPDLTNRKLLTLTPCAPLTFTTQSLIQEYKRVYQLIMDWENHSSVTVVPQLHKILELP